ncbi:MAG: glycosyltransferase [Candidatus Dormibacter sp.]|uniref:glycosyltransferase n=1 Tax=Candidatus Dormibacter sp. TaxID=2973982 RepID=UPI000DB56B57|nr:MAG: colanic acid biosynthesis glycosyltransferase WcaL [Candidatus Dormibacteraeota bacterium]
MIVGYLTKRFPRLSETFILDEILGLEACGVPLRLYAIAHPREAVVQPDSGRVKSAVAYLHGSGGWRNAWRTWVATARAHQGLLARDPHRYRAVFGYILRRRRHVTSLRHFWEAGYLAYMLEQEGARHIHAAFAHGPAAVAHFVHLLTGLSFSFAAHAKDLYLSPPDLLERKVADAEFVLVCTAAAAHDLGRIAGAHAGKIRLAPHGVDTTRFRPSAGGWGTAGPASAGSEPLRLLAVGRLVEKKGYPDLLEALVLARAAGHAMDLTVIGAGPLLRVLKVRAEELGLAGRVRFLGARTHQEVAAAYLEADVFVQASVVLPNGDRDGIPNSLLEAMASGLPVVATNVGGIPEVVVDGESGLLAMPGKPEALARLLICLAADRVTRQRLGRGARARVVEHFDRVTMIRAIAPLFGQPSLAKVS